MKMFDLILSSEMSHDTFIGLLVFFAEQSIFLFVYVIVVFDFIFFIDVFRVDFSKHNWLYFILDDSKLV